MANQQLLQRPLYVFDLPEELLYTLQPSQTHGYDNQAPPIDSNGPSPTPSPAETSSSTKATSCNLCGLTFENLDEQRGHVRSDLHKYNLKQRLRGTKPVSEGEFEKLIGDLDESLSGSDSEDSSDDDEDDTEQSSGGSKQDMLSALLKRQARLGVDSGEHTQHQQGTKRKRGPGKPPLYWFKSSAAPTNTSLGVYRAIFSIEEQEHESSLVETLRRKQLAVSAPHQAKKPSDDQEEEEGGVPLPGVSKVLPLHTTGPSYFLCMIGGGHFAAMLVALAPKKAKSGATNDRSATVLAHKTFHRYTTRRKQGGSQSANDNSKGNAHSAGSSLRRYNEAALETDIRTLLADWKGWIDAAELLFVRATGSTNRRTLFGPYDGQVLSQKDDRLRGFPFNTRRATQSELMRTFVELTRVKVSTVDEAALARQAAEDGQKARDRSQQSSAKSPAAKKAAQLSKEDEEAILHTTQLQALIRRSRAPALLSYLRTNSLSPDFTFHPPDKNHHAPTCLHQAAAGSSPACVSALLLKAGADPTIRNEDGRTAFELAGDRATRDAFCLARGQLGEDKWSWDSAGIPAALTQAQVDSRAARDKEEKQAEGKAESARREAEVERLRRDDQDKQASARNKKSGPGRTLAAPMTAEQRRMDIARGMTEEMRLRLEREQRARAAEERMRRLKAG